MQTLEAMSESERHAPVRYLLRHLAAGTLGSVVFGGLVLGFDLGGLGHLIAASPDGWLVGGLLFFGLFVTFGGLALAAGVMSMGKDPET